MFIRDVIKYNNYHPDSGTGTASGTGTLTTTAIEEALADVGDDADPGEDKADDKAPIKLEDESVDSDDDDDDDDSLTSDSDVDEVEEEEEKQKEEETDEKNKLNLEDEDELELAKIPTRKELKEAYPDIFKKFKALDHVIQREHAYAEVFTTVADARSAKSQVEDFNQFQSELLSGNIAGVLSSVKKANPNAFTKITDGLLDTLMKVDSNSHLGITARVTKGILNHIHSAASSQLKRDVNNKQAQQLQIAAELIHEAIFNTNEVTPFVSPNERSDEKENPEIEKFKTERAEFDKTRFQAAFSTVAGDVNRVIQRTVEKNIDPKGILPPYVKSRLVKETVAEIDKQLSSDTRFRGVVNKLWERAKDKGFNDESLNYIKSALKEKASTVITPIMRAKKGEALKGLSFKQRNENGSGNSNNRDESRNNRDQRTSQKVTKNRSDSDRLVPRANESIAEFLARD